jgi:hypothetical protein
VKITVEFETWEEMEAFRTSGKKTRSKKEEAADVEESVGAAPTVAPPAPPAPAPQFAPPAQGFPGNGAMPAAAPAPIHPLAEAIIAKIDGAITSGQPADSIVTWFRQQIGPEAANATIDQLKQVFIPRMQEMQLKQIAPQLGIAG